MSNSNVNKAKQVALFGYYGSDNFGDEAILSSFLQNFRFKDQVVVFSSNPKATTEEHGVDAVHAILPSNFSTFIIRILGRNRKNFLDVLSKFLKTKVLIIGGGGLFFDTKESSKYLFKLLRKISFASLQGKKIFICGVDLGPLFHQSSKDKIAKVFKKIESINFRNTESNELLKSILPSYERSNVSTDIVFAAKTSSYKNAASKILEDEISKEFEKNSKESSLVVFCLRGKELHLAKYKEAVIALAKEITEKKELNLLVLPLQANDLHDDRLVNKVLKEALPANQKLFYLKGGYKVSEYFDILSRADFIVSERLHGSIVALTLGTPLLGISYKDKVSRLFNLIEKNDWCLDLNEVSKDNLISKFNSLYLNREKSKKEIATFMPGIKKEAKDSLNVLSDEVEKALEDV